MEHRNVDQVARVEGRLGADATYLGALVRRAAFISLLVHLLILGGLFFKGSRSEVMVPLFFAPAEIVAGDPASRPAFRQKSEAAAGRGERSVPAEPPTAATSLGPAGEPTIVTAAELSQQGNPLPAYPAVARARGWEGDVRVKVTFGAAVNVVELLQSSGYEVLDDEVLAKAKLWRVSGSENSRTAWIVPIEFRLRRQD